MTPATQWIYAITLYLALCSLLKWSHRRNRRAFAYRRTLNVWLRDKAARAA